ncbi:hypothetical protein V6N12_035509 [Hibiscus sabdariffa]|uniref:Uncharacterized protein n=1 Tax=Hibiscus sabdariffa TaxID=183260 RepID=A0ABR2EN91_9ROSI
MSRTDGVVDSSQGGRPPEATINASNVVFLDDSASMSSPVLMQWNTKISFKDTLLGRSGTPTSVSTIPELDVENNLGVKGGLSKTKGAMGSRYLVLVEELGVEEGRLEPVRNDESQGLRLLGREKGLAHSAPASQAMIVTKLHGVTTDRTRSVPGNKEGLGSGSKKKARGDSSTVLISTARQSRTGEITDAASTGTIVREPSILNVGKYTGLANVGSKTQLGEKGVSKTDIKLHKRDDLGKPKMALVDRLS